MSMSWDEHELRYAVRWGKKEKVKEIIKKMSESPFWSSITAKRVINIIKQEADFTEYDEFIDFRYDGVVINKYTGEVKIEDDRKRYDEFDEEYEDYDDSDEW